MKQFAIVIAQMPAQVFLVTESSVTLAALERAVLVVDHFDVTLEVSAPGEAGIAQIASVRSLVGVRFQMRLQRSRFHDAVARQTLDASAFALAHDDRSHLDPTLAVFFDLFKILSILQK